LLLFTLPTVAGYQRWPQANNDVTVKTLYNTDSAKTLSTARFNTSTVITLNNFMTSVY